MVHQWTRLPVSAGIGLEVLLLGLLNVLATAPLARTLDSEFCNTLSLELEKSKLQTHTINLLIKHKITQLLVLN